MLGLTSLVWDAGLSSVRPDGLLRALRHLVISMGPLTGERRQCLFFWPMSVNGEGKIRRSSAKTADRALNPVSHRELITANCTGMLLSGEDTSTPRSDLIILRARSRGWGVVTTHPARFPPTADLAISARILLDLNPRWSTTLVSWCGHRRMVGFVLSEVLLSRETGFGAGVGRPWSEYVPVSHVDAPHHSES